MLPPSAGGCQGRLVERKAVRARSGVNKRRVSLESDYYVLDVGGGIHEGIRWSCELGTRVKLNKLVGVLYYILQSVANRTVCVLFPTT